MSGGSMNERLTVAVDADIVKVQAGMKQAEAAVSTASTKMERGTSTAATAAGNLGDKYGAAARQAASAAETIARTGTVSADAAKQLATQGAMMATMFGPAGAIAGATSIGLIAIVGYFTRIRDEARETREALEDEFATIRGLDSRGAADRVTKLAIGDRTASRRDIDSDKNVFADVEGLVGLSRKIAEVRAELAKAEQEVVEQRGVATEYDENAVNPRLASIDKELAAWVSLYESRKKLAAEAQRQVFDAKRAEDMIEGQRETQGKKRLSDQAAASKAKSEYTERISRAGAALEEMAKKSEKAYSGAGSVLNRMLAATNELRGIITDELVEDSLKQENAAREDGNFLLADLIKKRREEYQLAKDIKDVADRQAESSKQGEAAEQKRIAAAQAAYDAEIAGMRESLQQQDEAVQLAQAQAYALTNAANGALQLAEAMGLVSGESAESLRTIVQIAAAVKPLQETLKNEQATAGDLVSAWMPIIGGVSALVGSVFSARAEAKAALKLVDDQLEGLNKSFESFNRSFAPAATAFGQELQRIADYVRDTREEIDSILTVTARRAIARNDGDAAAALAELRSRRDNGMEAGLGPAIAQLEAYIAATKELSEAQRAATEAAREARRQRVEDLQEGLRERLLRIQGRDAEADAMVRAQAREDEFRQAIHDGADAITLAMLAMVQAAEEAAIVAAQAAEAAMERNRARRTQLGQRWEVMDITDPAAQLQDLVAHYGAIFPELADLLEGIDLTDPASVAQLGEKLSALFASLDPENLPEGMSEEMFAALIAAILELEGTADQVANGITTAAQRIAEAADSLNTDFEVFETDAVGKAKAIADLYGFGEFDLDSEEGRAAAEATLKELYEKNKDDPEKVKAILAVLRAIRGVPDSEDSAIEIGSASSAARGGSTNTASAGFQALTSIEGNRIYSVLRTIAGHTSTLPKLATLWGPKTEAPQFPDSYARMGGGANLQQNNTVERIEVYVDASGVRTPGEARELGATVGQAAAQAWTTELSAAAAQEQIVVALYSGNIKPLAVR